MIETFEIINEDFPWFFRLLVFVFGAICGSFLNVCIYRIPEGKSVVFPGSRCACGAPIAWYRNIPICSWLLLRGRAACCGAKFSVRYPAVELLTALLFLGCWLAHPPVAAVLGMGFIAFLICATFIDLDHMIIPDRFSIGGMVLGVALSTVFPQLHGIEGRAMVENIQGGITAVTGALIGAGLVYWIAVLGEIVFRKPAMGEGDVKFVGFIGAFCGWQGAVFAMFGGAFAGSVVLLPLLLIGRLIGKGADPVIGKGADPEEVEAATASEGGDPEEDAPEPVRMGVQVPFGPMLAAAGAIYFIGFSKYVDAYFEEIAVVFLGR